MKLVQSVLFFTILLIRRLNVGSALECRLNSLNPTKVAYTITVSPSGHANFTTVTDAIKFIPSTNDQWIKIAVDPGTYKEQIQLNAPCVVLEGQDRATTIITFDAHQTTQQSVTFAANVDNFVARGITFENSYNLQKGPNVAPAVAFGSFGDKQAFFSCGFKGYQDTLWDEKGRHYFTSCYIEGAIDFIWGGGQSVYEGCAINVSGGGFITAQGRESPTDSSGYVFRNCDVSGPGLACLGRAYRAFSRVIFIESKFSNCVEPEGWNIWDEQGHEGDTTFAEVSCTGPGADTSKRVPWMKKLSPSQLQQFDTNTFIDQDGWIAKLP